METEVQKAEKGKHNKGTCPGWYFARSGEIEGCIDCGFDDKDLEVYTRSQKFFAMQPSRHQPNHECHGCPGFDVFEVTGSVNYSKPYAIQRNDECSVFRTDNEAHAAAAEICQAKGYIVVDGDGPQKPKTKDTSPINYDAARTVWQHLQHKVTRIEVALNLKVAGIATLGDLMALTEAVKAAEQDIFDLKTVLKLHK